MKPHFNVNRSVTTKPPIQNGNIFILIRYEDGKFVFIKILLFRTERAGRGLKRVLSKAAVVNTSIKKKKIITPFNF